MQILLVAIGTYGDVLPFVAIAAEMHRRGHDVALAAAETFEPAARRAGVPFESLMSAERYAEVFEHPDFWRPFFGARRLYAATPTFVPETYEFIKRRHRKGETVVLASAFALGALVARDKLRIPTVGVHLTPILLQSRHEPPRMPVVVVSDWLPSFIKWKLQTGIYKFFITPLTKPAVNDYRSTLGLRPIKRMRKWWRPTAPLLLMFPDWFSEPQPDWPEGATQLTFPRADRLGATSDVLDPKLDAFLSAGEPPVLVTFGSVRFGSDALYRAAVEACAKIGRRCVVLSQRPAAIPAGLEDLAFWANYAPLGDVLPRCAAIVHHGGIGTASLGFAAGIPQIIAPAAFDQFDHAWRVRRLGYGEWIARRRFTAGRVAGVLAKLLGSPETAARCAEAAKALQGRDAVAEACDAIERQFGTADSVPDPTKTAPFLALRSSGRPTAP